MLPQMVLCDDCGKNAPVRGYGRVEYDWDTSGNAPTAIELKRVRLTIDCPLCGIKTQDYELARGLCQHQTSGHRDR